MSDDKKIEPVTGAAPVKAPGRVEPAPAVAAIRAAEPVGAVAGPAAVVAAIEARMRSGELDRPAAIRALVTEVVTAELGLDAESRDRMVDEVVSVLAEEPTWQARLEGLWRGAPR